MRNKFAKVSQPNDFVSDSGDRFHITYSSKVMPDGNIVLKESGKEDIQLFINSFRDSTDMSFIIKRLAMGDTSVLNQKVPMFGDFTQFPKTYAEVMQVAIDAESEFNKLPLDVRNKFDNSYIKWIAQAGNEEWLSKMGIAKKEAVDVVTDESEKAVTE